MKVYQRNVLTIILGLIMHNTHNFCNKDHLQALSQKFQNKILSINARKKMNLLKMMNHEHTTLKSN